MRERNGQKRKRRSGQRKRKRRRKRKGLQRPAHLSVRILELVDGATFCL